MKVETKGWGVLYRMYWEQGQPFVLAADSVWKRRNTAIRHFAAGAPKWWRHTMRKGLVKCVRVTITAEVPDEG